MEKAWMDYEGLSERISQISAKGIDCHLLTRSILGREIPMITLGNGKRAVLYVGAHRGTDSITTRLLLDFVADYLRQNERSAVVYEYPMRYLFEDRRIYIVPMLNPDGVEYVLHGAGAENPMRERVERMNGGTDFTNWQANARGVDLGHNYDAGFAQCKQAEREAGILGGAPKGYSGEFPESEPETAALCRFLRLRREEIKGVLSFHRGMGDIFCSCGDHLTAKTMSVGRVLSRFTGYRLVRPESISPIGTLADWCITALHRPAFTVHCGDKKDGSPKVIYEQLRRVLFSFPCLV